jgi:hypothetical protein
MRSRGSGTVWRQQQAGFNLNLIFQRADTCCHWQIVAVFPQDGRGPDLYQADPGYRETWWSLQDRKAGWIPSSSSRAGVEGRSDKGDQGFHLCQMMKYEDTEYV